MFLYMFYVINRMIYNMDIAYIEYCNKFGLIVVLHKKWLAIHTTTNLVAREAS